MDGKRLYTTYETMGGYPLVPVGVVHRLVINVRQTTFHCVLDGKYHFNCTPDYPKSDLGIGWRVAENDSLALGTHNGSVEFRSLQVVEATKTNSRAESN